MEMMSENNMVNFQPESVATFTGIYTLATPYTTLLHSWCISHLAGIRTLCAMPKDETAIIETLEQ
jgi:hypothetical protein